MTFFQWLCQQTGRRDTVGVFARLAIKDKVFPRHARRLVIFLIRYEHMPDHRAMVKMAHAEWRRSKRVKVAA